MTVMSPHSGTVLPHIQVTNVFYGALWTNDLNLTVGGSAIINYSSQALSLANLASGGTTLPAPVQLTSLIDCTQEVAGTAGCP